MLFGTTAWLPFGGLTLLVNDPGGIVGAMQAALSTIPFAIATPAMIKFQDHVLARHLSMSAAEAVRTRAAALARRVALGADGQHRNVEVISTWAITDTDESDGGEESGIE